MSAATSVMRNTDNRPPAVWRLAWRLLRRDWHSGELYLLAGALVLTVAAITAVGFFTDRIDGAMQRQGGELIAADLVIDSSTPLPEAIAAEATARGLATAHTMTFPSVVMAGEASQLVEVKAVDGAYPLRGRLRLADPVAPGGERPVDRGPKPGAAWVEPRLLSVLGQTQGSPVTLGDVELPMAEVIAYEPDRGANFFQIAPRVLIALEQVPATGLVVPASRVRHRLLLAGEPTAIKDFITWARPRLPPNADLIDAATARPEFESAVERATRFLHLAALTTLLVAGAAIALASRRLVERQTDAVAIMRCLGAPQHLLLRVLFLRLVLFGLLASLAGCAVGYAAQFGLVAMLADWFGADLPAATLKPALVGIGAGLIALVGFAAPPLLQLVRVPPLKVLRRDLGPPRASVALAAGAAALALGLLVFWQAGDPALAGKLLGGVASAVLALAALGWLMVWLAGRAAGRARGVWRLGLAGLARRPGAAILGIVGFGLGVLALLLLAVVRLDLLTSWQETLPVGAPNHFIINIQPDEVAPLAAFLEDQELHPSGLFPMIRGRLTGIAGRAIKPEQLEDPRAQRLAEREFNLSVGETLQADNTIISGAWWSGPDAPPQFSVEASIAETFNIKLGDTLRFWVAGREVEAPVTSIRKVQWDSFNVNFFVIGSPSVLGSEPATWVTSFYLPPESEYVVPELLRGYPSITLIDVGTLLRQVRGIIEQGIRAVEYVFAFTLAAGVLVMLAGIQASLAVRRGEHGVLRTLGASRNQLLRSLAVEFTTTGLLAGLMASLFAELTGWVLARELLDTSFAFNPWLWLVGVLGSGLVIGLAGTLGTWGVLVRPPLAALRRAG